MAKFPAKNIAADLQGKSPFGGYITLSAEKVLEANPEVIILVSPPQAASPQQVIDDFKKKPFWTKLSATQNNRVYILDYYGLVNAGSLDSIETATKQLQQVFSTP